MLLRHRRMQRNERVLYGHTHHHAHGERDRYGRNPRQRRLASDPRVALLHRPDWIIGGQLRRRSARPRSLEIERNGARPAMTMSMKHAHRRRTATPIERL